MADRKSRGTRTPVDLSIPVDIEKHKVSEGCFGKEWDMGTKECSRCADNELCGILFKSVVDKKVDDLEQEIGSTFLDKADFTLLDDKMLMAFVNKHKDGELSVSDLLQFVMAQARTSDKVAAVEWVKRFIKERQLIRTEGGKVWLR